VARCSLLVALVLLASSAALAEVTGVTITSRSVIAGGRSFGVAGPYEQLWGSVEFALDPADPHNANIVDLEHAARGSDGLVHFTSELWVLRPTDPTKGNGVLFFELANRGIYGTLLSVFNRGAANRDRDASPDAGDGLLMRDGYTLVWVGWEFDVPAGRLRVQPPAADLRSVADVAPISADIIVNQRVADTVIVDEPVRPPVLYPPADLRSAADRLTVRDRFWDEPAEVPRERWRFVPSSAPPRISLDGGFDPGRWYRVTYRAAEPVVAGVGLAAIRDAASAFRYRTDLPIRGRAAYVFGQSQTGRLEREFLYDGFNVDGEGRRVFDAFWIHKAGAARGSFNDRFAMPAHGDMFASTQFPFADAEEEDSDGARHGLLSRYSPALQPKVLYTNTPVEYWGGGRAAALQHTTVRGDRDLALAENVRMYVLAGSQHSPGPFPPLRASTRVGDPATANARSDGQELSNPLPHDNVMRGLLRAWHAWASEGTPPPASRYPRLGDHTLVPIHEVAFPKLPGVADPRVITGPARIIAGKVVPLPHLVPQVDTDGNDMGGIHDPEAAVPFATTTGWNFRAERVGNPGDIYQTLGSYVPFARTRAEREAAGDPRLSIEERYDGEADYVARVEAAAKALVQQRLMLEEDVAHVAARARAHWEFAMRASSGSGTAN
jgi:hypothetical protein